MNISDILHKCSDWQDFRERLGSLTLKQKGDCFESLTKHLLQLNPEYVTLLKNVWQLEEVPPRIRKYLNLPQPDEGIDLIAETKNGKYWAIQCKYRQDEITSLNRKELSTFTDLAFNICKHIELGLVCTNADRFSHKLTLYGERISFCSGEKWRALDTEFFKRLHKSIDGKTVPITPKNPRKHQNEAIQSAYKHFVESKETRGKLISPCGTGKSLTGYWIAERLKAKRILVAVPSLALINQTLEVWTRESVAHNRNIHWIAVCSDETVGKIEKDDITILTQDLGIRVHTDPDEISRWLKARKNGITVVFTTYQSGRATAEAATKAQITFDVGILDEAHKTVGKKDSLFSHLLYDENIHIKRRVFMTATERHYRGQSDEIVSMDNPQNYGEIFEILSFKKALETKPSILSDYKIVTITVSREEIASLIRENLLVRPDRGRWDQEIEAEMLAAVIALRKAMKKYPIRHAVSFHSSIARAKAFKYTQDTFSKVFPQYGKIETFHVSGNTPTSVRRRELDEFAEAKRSLVTNARCLTEGVDVPNIDCVLFADPKRSTIDIVQSVGRALRSYEGKQMGYVVVPVLLDSDIGDIKSQQTTAFDSILMVLRALAANDERIVEYFRTISQGKKWTGASIPVDIDIPAGLSIDADEFINSIKLKFWSRLAKISWRSFEEARAFVHGLGVKSFSSWMKLCKGELPQKAKIPKDIPTNPQRFYKYSGWVSWGDWLGTGVVASRLRKYLSFEDARSFVRSLGLKSGREWKMYSQGTLLQKGIKPEEIPSKPQDVYKDRWISMGDWLGTGRIATYNQKYRLFEEARKFVHSLKLKSQREWFIYCKEGLPEKGKKPKDIPFKPNRTYKDKGWISWGDWLGTGVVAPQLKKYRSFQQARAFVQSLRLISVDEWLKYKKGKLLEKGAKPSDIPAHPELIYNNKGWRGWGDWFGTGTISSQLKNFIPFEEARAFVQSLNLKSQSDWKKYCKGNFSQKGKKPDDIPAAPHGVYKNKGWISYGDWLGTGYIADQLKQYRPFNEARAFVHKLQLNNLSEWSKYIKGILKSKGKKPDDIPAHPENTYKNKGWINGPDWLGTSKKKKQTMRRR